MHMDEMLKESLDGFDSLWQRVTRRPENAPPPPPGAGSQEDVLLGLIHEETCAAAYAAALARMFSGDSRAMLQKHAAGAKHHLRRLRAEYYIATGVSGGTNEDCRALAGKLPGLRAVLLQARDLADRYERAADRADSPELKEALLAFAADERRQARELRSLLIESF